MNLNDKTITCKVCKQKLTEETLFSDNLCCTLKPQGKVPLDKNTNESHVEFMTFMNRLMSHPMYMSFDPN